MATVVSSSLLPVNRRVVPGAVAYRVRSTSELGNPPATRSSRSHSRTHTISSAQNVQSKNISSQIKEKPTSQAIPVAKAPSTNYYNPRTSIGSPSSMAVMRGDRIVVSSEKIKDFHLYPAYTSGMYSSQVLVPDVVMRPGRRLPSASNPAVTGNSSARSRSVGSILEGDRCGRRMNITPTSRATGYAGLDCPRSYDRVGRRTNSLARNVIAGHDASKVVAAPYHQEHIVPKSVRSASVMIRRVRPPAPQLTAPYLDEFTPIQYDPHFGRRTAGVILNTKFQPGSKRFTNLDPPRRVDRYAGYVNRLGNLHGLI